MIREAIKLFFKDFYDLYESCYIDEMTEFVNSIRDGFTPRVTVVDGIKSVKWALKATEAVLGKKIVYL